MNISLTTELEKFVTDRLSSGLYHSASEVIRDALRIAARGGLILGSRWRWTGIYSPASAAARACTTSGASFRDSDITPASAAARSGSAAETRSAP